MNDEATAIRMTSDIILERRRKSRNVRLCVYLALTLLVAWSVQVTIIDDTDFKGGRNKPADDRVIANNIERRHSQIIFNERL